MQEDQSSYSNPAVRLFADEVIVSTDARFRRDPIAPALASQRDVVGKCEHEKGHVLRVTDAGKGPTRIKCIHCPAEWVDEGF